MIEIKSDPDILDKDRKKIISVLAKQIKDANLINRVIFHSFDWALLSQCKYHAPGILTSYLTKTIHDDDIDIQKVELSSLRRQIGFVSQEPNLITGTVSENISISDPEINKSEIVEAAKRACAHEFIMNLENGYSTKIEERGGSLSGGQKQRIAIARALITKPKILILDEATSALDFITEKEVLRNIYKMNENCTVIFVTHRITNLVNFEKILLMSNGQIVEEGNFSQLIDQKGLFYAMSIENKFE